MKSKHKLPEIKSWTEWFERRAQYYDNPFMKMGYYIDGEPISDEIMQATIQDIWKKLHATNQCSLLDVGGGVGLFSMAYKSKLERVITTDLSFSMIKSAHKLNPMGEFLVCKAAALPFESSSFDRLLCYSVFHHFKNLSHARKVLAEFIRVVNNGGLIFIGDIPTKVELTQQLKKKRVNKIKGEQLHYPSLLKHNLTYLVFEPDFFIEFCGRHGLNCKVLMQNKIEGKVTASSRFDILIEVVKQ